MRKTVLLIAFVAMFAAAAVAKGIKHPSLLFTPDRVESARKALKTDTAMQSAWAKIKAVADRWPTTSARTSSPTMTTAL